MSTYLIEDMKLYINYGCAGEPMSTVSEPIMKGVDDRNYVVFSNHFDAFDFIADIVGDEDISIDGWGGCEPRVILVDDIKHGAIRCDI